MKYYFKYLLQKETQILILYWKKSSDSVEFIN